MSQSITPATKFAPFHRWTQMRFAKTTQHQASKVLRLQLKNGAPATKNQSPLLINLKRIVPQKVPCLPHSPLLHVFPNLQKRQHLQHQRYGRMVLIADACGRLRTVLRMVANKKRQPGASTPPPPDPPKIYYSINENIREQINWGILHVQKG